MRGGMGLESLQGDAAMSDIITGFRQVVQDLVAPELKAHTAKLDALQK
jgi:hypothetical protein